MANQERHATMDEDRPIGEIYLGPDEGVVKIYLADIDEPYRSWIILAKAIRERGEKEEE